MVLPVGLEPTLPKEMRPKRIAYTISPKEQSYLGALDWTRTSTLFGPAPQAGAATNYATSAKPIICALL